MKWLKTLTIICFCIVMILPIATFNTKSDVISEIDNRKLTENPFTSNLDGDLTKNIESYVSDRIGFRDKMILGYTVLNDRLFGKMVHPSYEYGRDGYVFGAGLENVEYGEYHVAFADMMKQLQNYCESRDIPFLMVFNPAKPAVLTEYIPNGLYYNRQWVDTFFAALDERGVNYLDNTKTLREKYLAGETVFNQKYDANHWNDLGAYYGVSEALKILKEDISTIHITTQDEMTFSETLKTSLPVSQFPIKENVPSFSVNASCELLTDKFKKELEINPSYNAFNYYVNPKLQSQGAPRALVFQGSYMNSYGYKYLTNAFGEYIYVHDYHNIFNFDYYFNIFKPECVIFEVAEYTFIDTYFPYDGISTFKLNKSLADIKEQVTLTENVVISGKDLTVQMGETLTTITWNTDKSFKYVWLNATQEYDFKKCDTGYKVTLKTEDYQKLQNEYNIVALDETNNTLIYMAPEK